MSDDQQPDDERFDFYEKAPWVKRHAIAQGDEQNLFDPELFNDRRNQS